MKIIETYGVRFVVAEKAENGGKCAFLCRRPNGRKLYYICLDEEGHFSKPKPVSRPEGKKIMESWYNENPIL